MFLAVSINVSPFDRLLPEDEKSIVSAPSRRAASAKLVLVRVEFSKNRLATVVPDSRSTFLEQLSVRALNCSAVSRIVVISSEENIL